MQNNNFILGLIVVLFAVIGFMFYKLICKRKEDIIKLLIKKDTLPAAANRTRWIQNGVCYMKDGSVGRVEGNDCVSIEVL